MANRAVRRTYHGYGKCVISKDSSIRKRMRAMRRGVVAAPEITERMLMRHAWYRKKTFWDAVRAKASQAA